MSNNLKDNGKLASKIVMVIFITSLTTMSMSYCADKFSNSFSAFLQFVWFMSMLMILAFYLVSLAVFVKWFFKKTKE